MRRGGPMAALATALCLAAAGWAGADEDGLERNPFRAPAQLRRATAPRAAAASQLPVEPEPEPVLRAILYAGEGSLANLDGTILAVGETVDGYRLVRVAEDSAVFVRRGRTLTLSLHPDEAQP